MLSLRRSKPSAAQPHQILCTLQIGSEQTSGTYDVIHGSIIVLGDGRKRRYGTCRYKLRRRAADSADRHGLMKVSGKSKRRLIAKE
jgi:hypothetical protein